MSVRAKPRLRDWAFGILIWIPLAIFALGVLAFVVFFLVPVSEWGVP